MRATICATASHLYVGDVAFRRPVSQLDTITYEQRLGYLRTFEATEVRVWYIKEPDWTRQRSFNLDEYLQVCCAG